MNLNRATFQMAGAFNRPPTADDYATECAVLFWTHRRTGNRWYAQQAERYAGIARRLSWAPRKPERTTEAA